QGGKVELGVVGEDHDVGGAVEGDLGQRLVRPGHDELVRLREPLVGGELGPSVHDGDPVAHQLGQPVERDGDVDGADDHQVRWPPVGLDEPVAVAGGLVGTGDAFPQADLTGLQVGAQLCRPLGLDQVEQLQVFGRQRLDHHLDVAAAGEADLEGDVVGDAVGDESSPA